MEIYLSKSFQQIGPFTEEEVYKLIISGEVNITDLAWSEGKTDWMPLQEMISLSPEKSKTKKCLWHYTTDTGENASIAEDKLSELVKCGIISRKSLMWRKGMTTWESAENVLSDLFPKIRWHYITQAGTNTIVAESNLGELARSGELSSSSLVWCKGMTSWEPAKKMLPELFPHIKWHYITPSGSNACTEENNIHELVKSGMIQRGTLVWRKGMPNWESAEKILPTLFV